MNLNEKDQNDILNKNINPLIQENNSSTLNEEIENNKNKKYLGLNLTTKKWRVKLYRLNENGLWDDFGIGFVFCVSEIDKEGTQINKLIMTNEITEEEMFTININKDKVDFHNQRGTIMTWKSGNDKGDDDTAISFQEKEGITEILKNILICEGKNPNDESLFMEMQSDIYFEVSIQNLPNLVRELNFDMGEQKIINFINYLKNNDCEFITQLGELLKEEEKKIENLKTTASSSLISNNNNNINENINKEININTNNNYNQQQIYKNLPMENIHYIFTIFKNLILIGDKDLIELLIEDEYYLITFGALEYDFETMKTVPHRKYFKDIVKFKKSNKYKRSKYIKKDKSKFKINLFKIYIIK